MHVGKKASCRVHLRRRMCRIIGPVVPVSVGGRVRGLPLFEPGE